MRASVSMSTAENGSSRTSSPGCSRRPARAKPRRWRWPPEHAHAELTDERVHALGQTAYVAPQSSQVEGTIQCFGVHFGAEKDVVAHGAGEEIALLWRVADRTWLRLCGWHAIHADHTGVWRVQTGKTPGQR